MRRLGLGAGLERDLMLSSATVSLWMLRAPQQYTQMHSRQAAMVAGIRIRTKLSVEFSLSWALSSNAGGVTVGYAGKSRLGVVVALALVAVAVSAMLVGVDTVLVVVIVVVVVVVVVAVAVVVVVVTVFVVVVVVAVPVVVVVVVVSVAVVVVVVVVVVVTVLVVVVVVVVAVVVVAVVVVVVVVAVVEDVHTPHRTGHCAWTNAAVAGRAERHCATLKTLPHSSPSLTPWQSPSG